MKLTHVSTQTLVAGKLEVAKSLWSRMSGLLPKASLAHGEGLVLPQCNSIHTIGMRFDIDVIFVDREWRVVALRPNVSPGKVLLPVAGASSVIELAGGSLRGLKIEKGDQLVLEPYIGYVK